MVEQEPPHIVSQTLERTNIAPLASIFITNSFSNIEEILFVFNKITTFFILISFLFLFMSIYSFKINKRFCIIPLYLTAFVTLFYLSLLIGADISYIPK